MVWIFFNKRICSFLTELTVGKAKVVRPEQIRLLTENKWLHRWRELGFQSFPCGTGHRPDLSQLLETALQKNTAYF